MSGYVTNPFGDAVTAKLIKDDPGKSGQPATADPYAGLYDSLDPDTQAQIEAHAKSLGMTVVQYMPFLAGQMGLNGEGGNAGMSYQGPAPQNAGPMADGMGFTGPNGQAPPSGGGPVTTPSTSGEGMTGHESSLAANSDATTPGGAIEPQAADSGIGAGSMPSSPDPAASPSATPPAGEPDTGFSSKFNSKDFPALAGDPKELARQWLMSQGLDPDSNSPLIKADYQMAQRAHGLYQLIYGGDNSAIGDAANNPKFLDWFDTYMKNGSTPGVSPMVSLEQVRKMLGGALSGATTNATDPNNLWASLLGTATQTDPTTGSTFKYRPDEQAGMLENLLLSALGGIIDPAVLKGMMGNVERSQSALTSDMYAGKQPRDTQWMDWLTKTGLLNGVTGGGQ